MPSEDMVVDHINGNSLDCRKVNMRICTQAENNQNKTRLSINNTSGIRGVSWAKDKQKWRSKVVVNGITYTLGHFKNIEIAELAVVSFRANSMPFSKEAR
jgi:hypothetical protein